METIVAYNRASFQGNNLKTIGRLTERVKGDKLPHMMTLFQVALSAICEGTQDQ